MSKQGFHMAEKRPFEGITIEELQEKSLGLDDTFPFHCRSCGKCCRHRYDISLSAFDLYRIAQFFGRPTRDIIDRYCIFHIEGGVPIVYLKANPATGDCPFLRQKKCSVHSVKPSVCRLFPLGRTFLTPSLDMSKLDEVKIGFLVMENVNCNAKDRVQSIRQWIGLEGTEEYMTAARDWCVQCTAIREILARVFGFVQGENLEAMHMLIATRLYLNYDTSRPFAQQFQDNIKLLMDDFSTLLEALDDKDEEEYNEKI